MEITKVLKFSLLFLAIFLLGEWKTFAIDSRIPDSSNPEDSHLNKPPKPVKNCPEFLRHLSDAQAHLANKDLDSMWKSLHLFDQTSKNSTADQRLQAAVLKAYALRAEEKTEKAREVLEKAIRKNIQQVRPEKLSEAVFIIGETYAFEGKTEDAIEMYKRASEIFPDDPVYQLEAGQMYHYLDAKKFNETGKHSKELLEKAVAAWETAYKTIDTNRSAKFYMGEFQTELSKQMRPYFEETKDFLANWNEHLHESRFTELFGKYEDEAQHSEGGGHELETAGYIPEDEYEDDAENGSDQAEPEPPKKSLALEDKATVKRQVLLQLWMLYEHHSDAQLDNLIERMEVYIRRDPALEYRNILEALKKLKEKRPVNRNWQPFFDEYLLRDWIVGTENLHRLFETPFPRSPRTQKEMKEQFENLMSFVDFSALSHQWDTLAYRPAREMYASLEGFASQWPDSHLKEFYSNALKIRRVKVDLDEIKEMVEVHTEEKAPLPQFTKEQFEHSRPELVQKTAELEKSFDRLDLSQKWLAAFLISEYYSYQLILLPIDENNPEIGMAKVRKSRGWIRKAEAFRAEYTKVLSHKPKESLSSDEHYFLSLSERLQENFQKIIDEP